MNKNKIYFITGKTGSGKTTFILNKMKENLANEDSKTVIIFALPNKDFVTRVKSELLEVNPLWKKLILEYVAGKVKEMLIEQYCSHPKNLTVPKVILTTHSYLNFRGDSFLVYPFIVDILTIKKVGYKIQCYIDEGHQFLNSLYWDFKLSGLYEIINDIQSKKIVPVTNVTDLNLIDESRQIINQDTVHTYSYDLIRSRNPKINWDQQVNKSQPTYCLKDQLTNIKMVYPIDHLDSQYEYITNYQFNLPDFNQIKRMFTKKNSFTHEVNKLLIELNLKLVKIQDLSFEKYIDNLLQWSPYYVRRTNNPSISYDGEPCKTTISGYNLYVLVNMMDLFEELHLSSSSLNKSHEDMFRYLDVEIINYELDAEASHIKPDFGAILLCENNLTPEILYKISQEWGCVLNFSGNLKKHDALSDKLYNNPKTKPIFSKYTRLYKEEILSHSVSDLSTSIDPNQNRILLTYWGSNLSTGVNLQYINICSVEMQFNIPLIFIPREHLHNRNDLINYIYDFIIQSTIQMWSRVCRQKGGFKILLLTRITLKKSDRRYELVERLLNSPEFKLKFDNFKIFQNIYFTDSVFSNFKNKLKNNKPLINPEKWTSQPVDFFNDQVNYIQQIDNLAEKQNIIYNLTRKERYIKFVLQNNQTGRGDSWTNQILKHDKLFLITNFNLNSEEFNICLGVLTENTFGYKHKCWNISDISTLIVFKNELLLILSKDKFLITFDESNFIILNHLLATKTTNYSWIIDEYVTVSKKRRVSYQYLENLVFHLINLKIMTPSNKSIDLYDIGIQLRVIMLPTELLENQLLKNQLKRLSILYQLFFDLFSKDNLLMYEIFLKELNIDFNFKPTFHVVLKSFVSSPTQKWSSLYLPACSLNVSNDNRNLSNIFKFDTVLIKSVIQNLKWFDLNTKNKLLEYYDSSFHYDLSLKKFKRNNNLEVDLSVTIGNVSLNLKNGGARSTDNTEFILTSSENVRLYELDFSGYYSSIIVNNCLLKNHRINDFYSKTYSRRQEAIKQGDPLTGATYKQLLNTVTGNLINKYSPLFLPEARFNMVHLGQIQLVNFIDFLHEHDCLIYKVHTDGLIVSTKNPKLLECIQIWSNNMNISVTNKELDCVISQSTGVNKIISKGNSFRGHGFNKNNTVGFQSSYQHLKPLIIADIIQGTDVRNKNSLNFSDLHKYVLSKKRNNALQLWIKFNDENEKLPVNTIRYVKVKQSNFDLYNQKGKIQSNILPIEGLDVIKYDDLNHQFYHQLARKEVNYNTNILTKRQFCGKSTPLEPVTRVNYLNYFNKLVNLNCEHVDFVPVYDQGKFRRGPLQSNVLTVNSSYTKVCAIAILIDANRYCILDIDNNRNLSNELRSWFLSRQNELFLIYHDNRNLSYGHVVNNKRFKIIFKCNPHLKIKLKSLVYGLQEAEIELCFTRKAYTVAGDHRLNKSTYRSAGGGNYSNLIYPDELLIQSLFNLSQNFPITKHPRSRNPGTVVFNRITHQEADSFFNLFKTENGGEIRKQVEDHSLRLNYHCPNKSLHSNPDKALSTDFSIRYFLKSQTLVGGCYHRSCANQNDIYLNQLCDKIKLGNSSRKSSILELQVPVLMPKTDGTLLLPSKRDPKIIPTIPAHLNLLTSKQQLNFWKTRDNLIAYLDKPKQSYDKLSLNHLRSAHRYYINLIKNKIKR